MGKRERERGRTAPAQPPVLVVVATAELLGRGRPPCSVFLFFVVAWDEGVCFAGARDFSPNRSGTPPKRGRKLFVGGKTVWNWLLFPIRIRCPSKRLYCC